MKHQRSLNDRYRDEGWGRITDLAFGGRVLPEDVESQARTVAQWAWGKIQGLESEIGRLEESLQQAELELSAHELE